MKKQIILGAIVLGFAASSFGQGYAAFYTTAKSWVYDNFSTAGTSQVGGTAGANIFTALLIGSGVPAVDAVSASNPTGNTTAFSASTGATIWSDILNDPNYQLAQNLSGNTLVVGTINTAGTTRGGFSYQSGASFQVAGWGNNTANTPVSVYVIGWNAAYATPALAAAAGAAVGWSSPFTYTLLKDTTTSPSSANASGLTAFGVTPIAAAPEPATMALAALGGASLLLFRRRK